MGMNETKIPEAKKDYLKEVAEMDFKKIQKGELTYDEAVTSFKKCNHLVCKILLGWMITLEEDEMLNMKYAEELKKLLDKAKEKPEPEEKKSDKDFDYYSTKCAIKSLGFMTIHGGDRRLGAAMAAGYTSALADAGIIKTKEDRGRFTDVVIEKMEI